MRAILALVALLGLLIPRLAAAQTVYNSYTPSSSTAVAPSAAPGSIPGWTDVAGTIWGITAANTITASGEPTSSSLAFSNTTNPPDMLVSNQPSATSNSECVTFAGFGGNSLLYLLGHYFASSGTNGVGVVISSNAFSFVHTIAGTTSTTNGNAVGYDVDGTMSASSSYQACIQVTPSGTGSQIHFTLTNLSTNKQEQYGTYVDPTTSLAVSGGVGFYNQISAAGAQVAFTNLTTYLPALAIGAMTATPAAAGVTVAIGAAESGGTGSGYSCALYRGTDPAFVESTATLISSGATFPYVDKTASAPNVYYYGVHCVDSGSDTIDALPIGFTGATNGPFYAAAQMPLLDVGYVFIGDSITYGQYNINPGTTSSPNITYYAASTLAHTLGLREVSAYNGGVAGSSTANWVPGQTNFNNTVSASNASSGASSLHAADPGALMLFSIMLGANDANQAVTAATFQANLISIVNGCLSNWPNADVIVNAPSYFTPNIYAGASTLSLAYSYRAVIQSAVASLQASHPGQVFLGDTASYGYFAQTYSTELYAQPSYGSSGNGTGYLHPIAAGAADLGAMWGAAAANALFAAASAPQFHSGFH